MTVTLTEKATIRLQSFLKKQSNKVSGIRVGVKDGGCNGYEYTLNLVGKPNEKDVCFNQNNISIYVDPNNISLLEGVVIDFVDSLVKSGFIFTNPNATGTCDCGKSFSTANCGRQSTPCS
jgi:iron-sulfur cluster assembly protein